MTNIHEPRAPLGMATPTRDYSVSVLFQQLYLNNINKVEVSFGDHYFKYDEKSKNYKDEQALSTTIAPDQVSSFAKEAAFLLTCYDVSKLFISSNQTTANQAHIIANTIIEFKIIHPNDLAPYFRKKYPALVSGAMIVWDASEQQVNKATFTLKDHTDTQITNLSLEDYFQITSDDHILSDVNWDELSETILQNHSQQFCNAPETFMRRALIGNDGEIVGFQRSDIVSESVQFGRAYEQHLEDTSGNPIEFTSVWHENTNSELADTARALNFSSILFINAGKASTHIGYSEHGRDHSDFIYYDSQGAFLFETERWDKSETNQLSLNPLDMRIAASSFMYLDGIYYQVGSDSKDRLDKMVELQYETCEIHSTTPKFRD